MYGVWCNRILHSIQKVHIYAAETEYIHLVKPGPAGGGGQRAPLRSPKLLERFPNFKRHSIALYVNYPYKVKNLTWRSLMTSQVRSKSEFSTSNTHGHGAGGGTSYSHSCYYRLVGQPPYHLHRKLHPGQCRIPVLYRGRKNGNAFLLINVDLRDSPDLE